MVREGLAAPRILNKEALAYIILLSSSEPDYNTGPLSHVHMQIHMLQKTLFMGLLLVGDHEVPPPCLNTPRSQKDCDNLPQEAQNWDHSSA